MAAQDQKESALFNIKVNMKKIIITILLFLIPSISNATQISYGTTYAPNGQVTSVNLNGNFNNVSTVVNGKLDNTNADTTNGYRFYKTVSVLPAAGDQGAVYFLTSDNTLNFDNGSSFTKSVSVSIPVQGNIIYYNGSGWVVLAPSTTGTPLITNGASANPSYGQVTATSTVSSTALTGSLTSGTSVNMLGSWSTKSTGSVQGPAATDLFMTAVITPSSGNPYVQCLTDSSNPPTTVRSAATFTASTSPGGCSTMVRKGDYYEGVVVTNGGGVSSSTVYVIPMGS